MGKNHAPAICSAARSGAAIRRLTVSGVALREAVQGLGVGTTRRACSTAGAVVEGAGGPAATGRLKAMSSASGMQIFSQTSHEAWPQSVTPVPTERLAGAVIWIGSTTSRSYPKLMN